MTQQKTQFIEDHCECLRRFKLILSELDISVCSLIDLCQIDDSSLPATHKFGAWVPLCGEKVAMSVEFTPEELKVKSFDLIIPFFAWRIRENLRPVAMEMVL